MVCLVKQEIGLRGVVFS